MIALDLDGVLASSEKYLAAKIAEKFDLSQDQLQHSGVYNNMYMFEDKALEKDVAEFISEVYAQEPVYMEAEKIEKAFEGAWLVHDLGYLKGYVTRRPSHVEDATRIWLARHDFPEAELIHVEKGTCKSHGLKRIDANIIIEDSPHEAETLLKNGYIVFLLDYPYNSQLPKQTNLIRFSSWDEIIEILDPREE